MNRRAKFDEQSAEEVRRWIETVVGIEINGDLISNLKDGTIICQLVNAIAGDQVARFKKSPMPFVQMENIAAFLRACEKIGVPHHELFETVDLYEQRDPVQVIITLRSLSRHAHQRDPTVPVVGPKLVASPGKQEMVSKPEKAPTPEKAPKPEKLSFSLRNKTGPSGPSGQPGQSGQSGQSAQPRRNPLGDDDDAPQDEESADSNGPALNKPSISFSLRPGSQSSKSSYTPRSEPEPVHEPESIPQVSESEPVQEPARIALHEPESTTQVAEPEPQSAPQVSDPEPQSRTQSRNEPVRIALREPESSPQVSEPEPQSRHEPVRITLREPKSIPQEPEPAPRPFPKASPKVPSPMASPMVSPKPTPEVSGPPPRRQPVQADQPVKTLSINLNSSEYTKPRLGRQRPRGPREFKPSPAFDDDDSDHGKNDIKAELRASGLQSAQRVANAETSVDPSVYAYDEVYDSMKAAETQLKGQQPSNSPRYIDNILKSKAIRDADRLKARDVKLKREREAEGDQYDDKESFVTSAYKKQQAQLQEQEQRDAQQKQPGSMADFHKQMLDSSEKEHQAIVDASKSMDPGALGSVQSEQDSRNALRDQAKMINRDAGYDKVKINDEGELVDDRQVLSGGLNVVSTKKRSSTHDSRTIRSQEGSSSSRMNKSSFRSRTQQTARVMDDMREHQEKERQAKEEQLSKLADTFTQKKTSSDAVASARERYLARKKAKLDNQS